MKREQRAESRVERGQSFTTNSVARKVRVRQVTHLERLLGLLGDRLCRLRDPSETLILGASWAVFGRS